jgi:hypothetical protein
VPIARLILIFPQPSGPSGKWRVDRCSFALLKD